VKKAGIATILLLGILLVLGPACGSGEWRLLTHTEGEGTISSSTGTFPDGEVVTLTALPESGWEFDHWGGQANGSENPITITMDSAKTVYAYFTLKPTPSPTISPSPTPTPISLYPITIAQPDMDSSAVFGWSASYTNVGQGQSFLVPQAGLFGRFEIYLTSLEDTDSADVIVCDLRDDSGNVLQSVSIPGFVPGMGGWKTFDFEKETHLTGGRYYCTFYVSNPKVSHSYGIHAAANETSYPYGSRYDSTGGHPEQWETWESIAWDLAFAVEIYYYTPIPTPTPISLYPITIAQPDMGSSAAFGWSVSYTNIGQGQSFLVPQAGYFGRFEIYLTSSKVTDSADVIVCDLRDDSGNVMQSVSIPGFVRGMGGWKTFDFEKETHLTGGRYYCTFYVSNPKVNHVYAIHATTNESSYPDGSRYDSRGGHPKYWWTWKSSTWDLAFAVVIYYYTPTPTPSPTPTPTPVASSSLGVWAGIGAGIALFSVLLVGSVVWLVRRQQNRLNG